VNAPTAFDVRHVQALVIVIDYEQVGRAFDKLILEHLLVLEHNLLSLPAPHVYGIILNSQSFLNVLVAYLFIAFVTLLHIDFQ
jgi:hypothetical protein